MKCLLLNSPIYEVHTENEEDYLPPLGLGYIATHIKSADVEVEIIDCVKERLGINEIIELLRKTSVEYIGINVFTQNFELVKEIVENCPIVTTIIIGGQVVKCLYNEILKWDVANNLILVIGEGELLLPSLINGTCEEQPIKRTDGKVVYYIDRNSRYFPDNLNTIKLDRTLIKDDITCNHYNQKEASIITSRGCMYNCAFCGGASSLNGHSKIRFRNNSDIRNEILDIIKIHPSVTSIRVLDDLFLRNEESIRNATELFNQYPNLTWRGMAHVLTFPKIFGTLPQLKASGCRELFIGIESGSKTIRKRINKPGSPKDVVDVITMLLVAGIDIKGYFMYGFPDETTDEADETFALASELDRIANNTEGNLRLSVFQFRPYHGTQLYNEIESRGISIGSMKSNEGLNAVIGRSQFNFHSGNYSNIEDEALRGYIQKTQNLSEVSYV